MDAGKNIDFLMKAAEDGLSDAEKAVPAKGDGGVPETKTDGEEKTEPEGKAPSKTDGEEKEPVCTCPEGKCTCGEKKAADAPAQQGILDSLKSMIPQSAREKANEIANGLGKPNASGVTGGLGLGALMAAAGAIARSSDPEGKHSILSNPALLGLIGTAAGYAAGNKYLPGLADRLANAFRTEPDPKDAPIALKAYIKAHGLAKDVSEQGLRAFGAHDTARLLAEQAAGLAGYKMLKGIGEQNVRYKRLAKVNRLRDEYRELVGPYVNDVTRVRDRIADSTARRDFEKRIRTGLQADPATSAELTRLDAELSAARSAHDTAIAQRARADAAFRSTPSRNNRRLADVARRNAENAAAALSTARTNLDAFVNGADNIRRIANSDRTVARMLGTHGSRQNVDLGPAVPREARLLQRLRKALMRADIGGAELGEITDRIGPAASNISARIGRLEALRNIVPHKMHGSTHSMVPRGLGSKARFFSRYAGGLAGLGLGAYGLFDLWRTAKNSDMLPNLKESLIRHFGTADINEARRKLEGAK